MKKDMGFTIVELLVVIVIIGILSTISVVSYGYIVTQAKTTKTSSDLGNLVKIIDTAKTITNQTVTEITGAAITGDADYDPAFNDKRCYPSYRIAAGLSTDLRNLPDSDLCIYYMKITWDTIASAASMSLSGHPPKDAWGSPYIIDANEDESWYMGYGAHCLYSPTPPLSGTQRDLLLSVGPNGVYENGGDDIIAKPMKIRCP